MINGFPNDQVINCLPVEKMAEALAVDEDTAVFWWWELFFDPEPIKLMEFLTQKCTDCGTQMEVHQDASWRLALHPIRCAECAQKAVEAGYNYFESFYVD